MVERYLEITKEQREMMIEAAKSGTKVDVVSFNIFEKGNTRRLYINFPEWRNYKWRSGGTFIDLKIDDLTVDFGSNESTLKTVRAWLDGATEQKANNSSFSSFVQKAFGGLPPEGEIFND